MSQRSASILTALDLAEQVVLGHRDEHVHRFTERECRWHVDADRDAQLSIMRVNDRDLDEGLRSGRRLGDRVVNGINITPDAFKPTVDDELRRVHLVAVEHSRVVVRLPAGVRRGGKRISPTQTVPIIDVLTKRQHLDVRRRLSRELAQHIVGWWAARAAFRREQLSDDDGPRYRR